MSKYRSEENHIHSTFGGEVGSGCGCVLVAIAIILLFNIGGATTAIVHHFFGG